MFNNLDISISQHQWTLINILCILSKGFYSTFLLIMLTFKKLRFLKEMMWLWSGLGPSHHLLSILVICLGAYHHLLCILVICLGPSHHLMCPHVIYRYAIWATMAGEDLLQVARHYSAAFYLWDSPLIKNKSMFLLSIQLIWANILVNAGVIV